MRARCVGVMGRGVVVIGVLFLPLMSGSPVMAGGVVGNGNRTSCSEAAFDAALVGGGSVTFNCGAQPFTLTVTAPKTIALDTSLDGGGLLTLSGGGKLPIFFVNPGAAMSLNGATLRDGRFSFGGAIYSEGTLTVTNCTFSHNHAPGPGDGGAIDNYGTLTVTNSTFIQNGTYGVSGAIENNGTLTVTNSTFSRNRASVGGAIASAGPLTITNCTFSRNRAAYYGSGGAIYSAGDTIIQNTILANSGRGRNCVGPVIDGGHNLRWPLKDNSCVGTYGNPKLARLTNHGGLTSTFDLRPGSAAINAGDNAICTAAPVSNADQRGFVRPGTGATNCPIGAYEFNAPIPSP